jgi:hypothetical protein
MLQPPGQPLYERWPHLCRPGPQPHNQIGTLRQQLDAVATPRPSIRLNPTTALYLDAIDRLFRRFIAETYGL